MADYNAKDYITSSFIKKEELRTGGPRQLVIKAVEEGDGLPGRSGQPARKQLHLVFTDDSRFGLSAQINLKRVFERLGPRTSAWIGQTLELYFSPDVTNPGGGPPGGIRVRFPEATTTPGTFVSELDDAPPKPNGADKQPTKRVSRAGGTRTVGPHEDETAF